MNTAIVCDVCADKATLTQRSITVEDIVNGVKLFP